MSFASRGTACVAAEDIVASEYGRYAVDAFG